MPGPPFSVVPSESDLEIPVTMQRVFFKSDSIAIWQITNAFLTQGGNTIKRPGDLEVIF